MSKHRLNNRWILLLALLLPLCALATNAWLSHQQRTQGNTITLPIQGFDPRDLLAGHYLTYDIDYGISDEHGCPASHIEATACLQPERHIYPSDELPDSCTQYISGNCNDAAQFIAGLERFYVPEKYAKRLEAHVQNGEGQLVITLDGNGKAAIRDLLINDRPWKTLVQQDE